ncbi:MAG: hypothetical protein KJ558_03735 [Gammaproteobacteria bacterium]|nr:hypothetical protein [Gammaproteobacteria bacterium]MBU1653934.1 hypothetical protein [Gammaproteobacteria bacterium]MBU1960931.1 hypothetical protein [Gammaproteobacteria bacterium]
MKLQYLGDSKDSFKWDYHDYLTNSLGFELLNILLMMTPDDNTTEGNTKPDWFPARMEIIKFCKELRTERDLSIIKSLPTKTGASYKINLHNPGNYISRNDRNSYFHGLSNHCDQIVFLDPDNGLEPEKKYNEKHLRYLEISSMLDQISNDSVISVFQHFRRIKFTNDFASIKERLLSVVPSVDVTGVFWHQLMFVVISKSITTIGKIRQLNSDYARSHPVEII